MGYVVEWYADQRDRAYGAPTRTTFATLDQAAAFAREHRGDVVTVTDDAGAAISRGTWLAYGLTNVFDDDEFEVIGAAVDQTSARVLEARWLAFIRDCGSASPSHATFQYLGGDVTDVFNVPGSDDILWIGADWFDGTTVVTGSDTYAGTALPVRNGAVQENTPGTFGIQLHRTGNTGVWLDAVADGGNPTGYIWWPLCVTADGGTNVRVGCLLVDPSVPPYGRIVSSQIVTLNLFGTYGSHVDLGITDFQIDGMWRDTTHTYVLDEPSILPIVTLGEKTTRIARVVNGSLLTVAAWEFWDGASWVADPAARAPLVDTSGNVIRGDSDIAKLGENRYLLVAHFPVGGEFLDVYKSSQPQGHWAPIARVPLPSIGHIINGGEQVAQIPRIIDSTLLANAAERPPAEYSTVVLSRNLVTPTDSMTVMNIRRFAPLIVNVPNN